MPPSSVEWVGSIWDSLEPDGRPSLSPKSTRTPTPSSPTTGPESPTSETSSLSQSARVITGDLSPTLPTSENHSGGGDRGGLMVLAPTLRVGPKDNRAGSPSAMQPVILDLRNATRTSGATGVGTPGTGVSDDLPMVTEVPYAVLTGSGPSSGQEASPAKTSASPESGPGSQETDPASPSPSWTSLTFTDLEPSFLRTSPDYSPAMPVETLGRSSVRWSNSGMAWRGASSTQSTSACPSAADGSSSLACGAVPTTLTDILQPSAPQRFSLSGRAANGILRRAGRRGRALPTELEAALTSLATSEPASDTTDTPAPEETAATPSSPTPSPETGPPSTEPTDPSTTSLVRRLTPLECERLMGWPDGWTIAPGWRSSPRAGGPRASTTTRRGSKAT